MKYKGAVTVHRASGVEVTMFSGNSKLTHNPTKHHVHTTTLTGSTCPPSCPFYISCYGKTGYHMQRKVRRVSDSGPEKIDPLILALEEAEGISKIPGLGLLRIHDFGDMLSVEGSRVIAKAVRDWKNRCNPKDGLRSGRNIWYTRNRETVRDDYEGISILKSCQTSEEIQQAHKTGFPAAVVVNADLSGPSIQTISGQRFLLCPNEFHPKHPSCSQCGACANSDRLVDLGLDIGFLAKRVYREITMQSAFGPKSVV